jgi:hypothetical protein
VSTLIIICCDVRVRFIGTCRRRYPVPMPDLERAESAAARDGWLKTNAGHICPEHAKETR